MKLWLRNHVDAASRSIAFKLRNIRVRPGNEAGALRARQVLHPTPWMQHASPILDEREIAATAGGLIIRSINREPD